MSQQARNPGSAPTSECDVRKRFDATFWGFRQVVAWIFYRTPEHLDAFALSPRGARWYVFGADAVLRRAIERGVVIGFDENGHEIKPAAVLGRDPKIRFNSRAIKARWTPSYSLLVDKAEQSRSGKTSGRKESYDGAALRTAIEAHLKAAGPFASKEALSRWCLEPGRVKLRRGAKPPPGKRKGDPPDPHTLTDIIKRHQLDKIPGLFAES